MTSTLDGTYTPHTGDTVWQQMYSPTDPAWESTIHERVAAGKTYGEPRKMIVHHITHSYAGEPVDRWCLQAADPNDRRGEANGYSWVESNWCVLQPVDPAEEGRLL